LLRDVVSGPPRQVQEAVAVQVAERSHRRPEKVARMQDTQEAAGRGADLLRGLHRACAVQEQDPHRSCAGDAIVIEGSTDRDVLLAIAVEVADRGERETEV
jgi:hypothetical protein